MNLHRTKKNKFILTTSCTLLAVITAGVAVMSATQTALARATLPGVEKIIEDNGTDNPFVILEIVPEKEDASLGFLVAGEEPVDASAKSIKDMPSAQERSARMGNAADDEVAAESMATAINEKINALGIGNAVGFSTYAEQENATGNAVKNVDIRGEFTQSESELPSGDYALRDATDQYDTITVVEEDTEELQAGEYKPSQLLDLELYRRHMAFRSAGEGNSDTKYAVKLEPLGDTTDLPVKFVKADGDSGNAHVSDDSPVIDAYNHQYFVIERDVEVITKDVVNEETGETETVVDTDAMASYIGEMIFLKNADGSLSYIGVLTNTRQAMLMFARPPVNEEETERETISGNEIETETETESETESTTETESETESTTETATETPSETTTTESSEAEPESPETTTSPTSTEPTTPETTTTEPESPATPTPSVEDADEPSGEDLLSDDQARAFTTKKMYRMSVSMDDIVGGIERDFQYVVVKEADGSDSNAEVLYYIDSVAENEDADLVANENYNRFLLPDTQEARNELVGETFYVRKDNTLPYEYKPDNDGTHTFTADYTQEIYDTVSYTGGFTNEEWFKKYVFDLETKEELDNMCIDVVTVTWKELVSSPELADELLAKADLIYFADPDNKGFQAGDTVDTTDDWIVQFDFDDADGYKDGGVTAKGDVSDSNGAAYFGGWNQFLTVDGLLNNSVTGFSVSFTMNTTKGEKNWPFFLPYDMGTTPTYLTEKYLGMVVGWENGIYRLLAERYYITNENSRPACAQAQVASGANTDISVYYGPDNTTIYVDGQQSASQGSEVALSSILSTEEAKPFWIGKSSWTGGEYYQGTLDNYVISSAATPDEIAALQQKTRDNADSIYNAIVKKASEGLPVVLNRSLFSSENNDMAVRKMAACLMRDDIPSVFGNDGADARAVETMSLTGLTASMREGNAFVVGNVFVYDDAQEDVVSGKFADKNFYSDEQITKGFLDVVDEIENENFYLEVAGKENRISEDITMATAIRHIINFEDKRVVTKTSLRVLDLEPYDFEDYYPESAYANESYSEEKYRHKTVYEDIKSADADRDSAKIIETDSICITDGKLDKNRWITDNIAPQFETNPAGLDVTIMGTKEFIGKLDDLNAEYDLIYLGLDTSIMNTRMEGDGDARTKTDETVYNDSAMNGLVYTHVGDLYPIDSTINSISGNYRLSGNDITYDKLRELREYIEAGYAVIISDGFLKKEGNALKVNTDKIDSSSNMYKLINETVLATDNGAYRYFGKNVNTKSNLEDGAENAYATRETFNRYLNISKLQLKYSDADLPAAYNQSDEKPHYLSADSDGIYRLYFNIELENDAAVGLSSTTYDCKLYVDMDADGRYENVEVLTGLSITDSSGNTYQADGEGHFRLKAGEKYRISREIPEGYTGFLAWKLVFEMNDRTYAGTDESAVVRSHIIGYSAVPVSGIKPTINILQITTHPATAGEINTTLDLNDEHMHTLYAGVQDFDIQIKQIPASEYVSMSDTHFNGCATYAEYLKQFDMLVMGFTDMYKYGSAIGTDHIGNAQGRTVTEEDVINSMLAIREYALSGRSMMFTHDLNSMHVDPNTGGYWRDWGWYANQILRDIQGMDRFGVLKASSLIPGEDKYEYESRYDEPYLEGEKVDNAGLSNPLVLNWDHKARLADPNANWEYKVTFDDVREMYTYGETSRLASWNYKTHLNYQANGPDHGSASYVSKVNSGQITEYPYDIKDTFAATHSHPQYLQLNMDTDNRDANNDDDIVVWYALDKIPEWCDSLFGANEMDVRNNFFIYNKGNITYTGSGDSRIDPNDDDKIMERKLFVNTLVASYRSGTHAARALFKESEWETSATITSTYLPYDPAMNDGSGGFLNQELTLNFKTTNMDLRKSDDSIYVKFYVDGSADNHDLAVDGNYYKEITVESINRLVVQDGSIAKVPEGATVISNNSMHQVKFKHEQLGLMDGNVIRAKNATTLYIRLGYEEMENGDITLPATESISGLNIVCTQLFELK